MARGVRTSHHLHSFPESNVVPSLKSRRPGFTLIELLVVIAIIAILIGLLAARRPEGPRGRRPHASANNLKQIGLALHNYHDTFNSLPPGRIDQDGGATWCVLILPFIEQENLFKLWHINKPYYLQIDCPVQTQVATYYCPAGGRRKTTF